MNMVMPIEGSVNVIRYIGYIWSQVGAKVTYHLYKNDVTPDADTVIGDLTEANFSGYASHTVTGWGYTSPGIDVDSRAVVLGDENFTATHNGGGTNNDIYGYYVTDNSGGLLWAQRLDSPPIPVDANGKFVTVVPKFTLRSQFGHA